MARRLATSWIDSIERNLGIFTSWYATPDDFVEPSNVGSMESILMILDQKYKSDDR